MGGGGGVGGGMYHLSSDNKIQHKRRQILEFSQQFCRPVSELWKLRHMYVTVCCKMQMCLCDVTNEILQFTDS